MPPVIRPAPAVEVREDGATFADNARLKALAYMRATGLPALADDSGLEVAALGGLPGVRSARFAGEDADDAANNARLLAMMRDVADRRARFVCVVCLVFPDGTLLRGEGAVEGEILPAPRGVRGFGYDPLFLSHELGKTFAEAEPEEKARVSHRARALAALARALAGRLEGQRKTAP